MKWATALLALGGLSVLSGCMTPDVDETTIHHLPEARIIRVVPAPWYFGITATLGKIEAEDPTGQRFIFYRMDLTKNELPRAPKVGEVCSIAYTHHKATFDWLTGDVDSSGHTMVVLPGERILMAESATCGSTIYDLRRAPGTGASAPAGQNN